MSTVFNVKQSDTGRSIRDTLLVDGSPLNLTGATVQLIISRASGTLTRTATVDSASGGVVSYAFVAEDLADVGYMNLEWKVTQSGGAILRFPDEDYIRVRVVQNLG